MMLITVMRDRGLRRSRLYILSLVNMLNKLYFNRMKGDPQVEET